MRNQIILVLIILGVLGGLWSAYASAAPRKRMPPLFTPATNPYPKGIYAEGIVESDQASGANINVYPEVAGTVVGIIIGSLLAHAVGHRGWPPPSWWFNMHWVPLQSDFGTVRDAGRGRAGADTPPTACTCPGRAIASSTARKHDCASATGSPKPGENSVTTISRSWSGV